MTTTSRLNEVEDAVKAAIDARAANPASPLHLSTFTEGPIPVDLGEPDTQALQPEHVWTGETTEINRTPESTGAAGSSYVEEFTVDVLIYVERRSTYQAMRDRSSAIAEDLESSLGGPALVGAAGILDAWIAGIGHEPAAARSGQGRLTTIHVFARAYLAP